MLDLPKNNTSSIQFRIDPKTRKKLNQLKRAYGTTAGPLIKAMINKYYEQWEEETGRVFKPREIKNES